MGGSRTGAAVAFIPAVLLVAACSSPAVNGAAMGPGCDVSHVTVSVDAQLTIRVENSGPDACRLSGTPAVSMKVGRINGPLPTADVTLRPGQTFVQPQKQVPNAWACPGAISSGLPGTGLWTVTVQNQVVHPVNPDAQLGRQVVTCWVVTLPQGHVTGG